MRSINPSLQSKINKQNQTIYENANPKMSVVIARARSSIMDSSYFTVENIRTKTGITDISVATRRRKAYGVPDGLFDIHLDNGVAKTTFRAYPDKLKIGWQPQFSIGSSKAVAICFNGHWERYRELWQLATEEYPDIFWVDASGKLFTQHWDEELTKYELATNVLKVKAVRGWKNVNFQDRDHGLIVGYIKTDGKLYYRNYCTQVTGETAWENEQQVEQFTGTAVNLNMFLTNDYRTAFIVEDSLGKTHWIITDRNWAGMAVAPHTISVAPTQIIGNLIPIEYPTRHHTELLSVAPVEISGQLLYAVTDNEILSIKNIPTTMLDAENVEYEDWGWAIEFEVKNPTPNLTLQQVVFTSIESGIPIGMVSIETIGENKYKVVVDSVVEVGMNNIFGDIKATIMGAINPAGYSYDTITKDFTPINLEPEFIPLPIVDLIWNE